jgi:hypothetical protein
VYYHLAAVWHVFVTETSARSATPLRYPSGFSNVLPCLSLYGLKCFDSFITVAFEASLQSFKHWMLDQVESGFCQRRFRKRAKSPSVEQSINPCSMASCKVSVRDQMRMHQSIMSLLHRMQMQGDDVTTSVQKTPLPHGAPAVSEGLSRRNFRFEN